MNPLETQNSTAYSQNQAPSFSQDNPFSPKGRFSRLSYLAWMLIVGILYTCVLFIVAGIAGVAVFSSGIPSFDGLFQTGAGYFAIFLIVVTVIVFTVISICISIRRIHDLNKSGWLWLLFLVPIANIIFGIYIMCAKGTIGPNSYGPERVTEQTEKLLGTIYAVFLAIFIVAYGAIGIWYYKMLNSLNLPVTTTEMTESQQADLEQELTQAGQQIEDSTQEIEQAGEEIEQAANASDDATRAAQEAVEAANDSVEAEQDRATQEINHQ